MAKMILFLIGMRAAFRISTLPLILHNPMFYNGVIKIQKWKAAVDCEEKAACQCLLKEGADLAATSSAKLSVAENSPRGRRRSQE